MNTSNNRVQGAAQATINKLTKGFTNADGTANANKIESLNAQLESSDEGTQEVFKEYIQSLRDQAAGKFGDDKSKKTFEKNKKTLSGMGGEIGEVADLHKKGSRFKEIMGIQQGPGNNPFNMVPGNFGKAMGFVEDKLFRDKNIASPDEVSDSLKKIASNVGGGFAEEKRKKEGGTSSSGQKRKVPGSIVGSGKDSAFTGGIDSSSEVIPLLVLIEENTRALKGSKGGGTEEEGGFWDTGKTIAATILAGAGAYIYANKDKLFNDDGSITTQGESTIVKSLRLAKIAAVDAPLSVIKAPLTAAANIMKPKKIVEEVATSKLALNAAGRVYNTTNGQLVAQTSENVAKATATTSAEVVAKQGTKSFFKKIPLLAAVAGTVFAAKRLMDGDVDGAAIELTSGFSGAIPTVGTAVSVAADVGSLARDIRRIDYNDLSGDKIYDRGWFGGIGSDATLDREKFMERMPNFANAERTIGQILADDDLSDEDEEWLRGKLKGFIDSQTIPTGDAINNTTDDVTGAVQEVVVVNPPPTPQKIEVDKVVSAVMPHSVVPKNHSFQRFQDFASMYS